MHMQHDSFRRWAAILAITSAVVALASMLLPLPAAGWDVDALSSPGRLLQMGNRGAAAMKWGLILDLLGYYLLIAPLALLLRRWLVARAGDWATLLCGLLLAYVLIGAAGAAVLAATLPRMMSVYTVVPEDQRAAVAGLFNALWDAVYGGLWNMLEELLAGLAWLGLGWLMRGEGRRFAGVVTMVLGGACLLDVAGTVLGRERLAAPGLYLYLLLAPLWAAGMGIAFLRRPPVDLDRARVAG
jgi:hypothetical protein